MSILSLLRRLEKALPVILANAPVVIAAAKEVRNAARKEKKKKKPADAAA